MLHACSHHAYPVVVPCEEEADVRNIQVTCKIKSFIWIFFFVGVMARRSRTKCTCVVKVPGYYGKEDVKKTKPTVSRLV